MHNWTQRDARAGIITNVSTALDDLVALYRFPSLEPSFADPNPPDPDLEREDGKKTKRDGSDGGSVPEAREETQQETPEAPEAPELAYWRKL
jgi:hypothetical protein